ncbi:serine-rich adhesin for platelets-like [Musca vetustissima]|uniref:serine-rich adhesin for platelets-like n=1 Tax=Musca vetustissima TaxID=27455 RepID=UPI002AB7141C|nr:serine-rich adhesin for platelets-like [Musca vetustissima]
MFGLLNTTQIYGIQTQTQQQPQHHQGHEPQQHYPISFHPEHKSSDTLSSCNNSKGHHRRTASSVSDTSSSTTTTNKFFTNITSKSPTNFLEKFLKSDLLNTYDTLKNYRNSFPSTNNSQTTNKRYSDPGSAAGQEGFSFNCLHGSYRHSFDGEFYEKAEVKGNNHNNKKKSQNPIEEVEGNPSSSISTRLCSVPNLSSEMTIKCSKNLLAVEPEVQGPATLQNYQKIPESEHDLLVDSLLVASSGASSGEFNSSSDATTQSSSGGGSGGGSSSFSSSSSNLYKRLSFGGMRNSQKQQEKNGDNSQQQQQTEGVTDNSTLSLNLLPKVIDLHRSSSSNSSSGDCLSKREQRKKGAMTPQPQKTPLSQLLSSPTSPTPGNPTISSSTTSTSMSPHEKAQRRKLLQMLAQYDQQNKFLQRELTKEKRRRSEELACVVKSLLCFESKLKTDMKSVNQRLATKDGEICRLVRQNRALRKKLCRLRQEASECARDEGVVEDGDAENDMMDTKLSKDLLDDDDEAADAECLVMEALQCINCRRQFYDIEVQETGTQTTISLATATGDDPTTEHGSSSDDTVSSSFFGARRSVRYTSKRTSGTFRDYMRSRAMNIDDPSLEADNNSEEYPSTLSRDDSRENIYSRTIERMHGVKCNSNESERDSEHSGVETNSTLASTKSSKSSVSSKSMSSSGSSSNAMEEDDGIFSPTQEDEDFDDVEEQEGNRSLRNEEIGTLKIVRGRALEAFSEASPKQIYETSTDDWYASASDQEEMSNGGAVAAAKSYGHGAVNPVLECVNQILLQQSMEGIDDRSQTPKNSRNSLSSAPAAVAVAVTSTTALPRRSSLSDRRNNRSNSKSSSIDGALTSNSRNGTLTRKRVHFSTKNSMVHVPRNDETEDEEEEAKMISNQYQLTASGTSVAYMTHSPPSNTNSESSERLEIFNYESIYSNEYEPIGSEMNSSNLYVDMDATTVSPGVGANGKVEGGISLRTAKLPPALPPKPANLLKFKKSLQQLDESPDENLEVGGDQEAKEEVEPLVEPDYCSISEVNVGITSVQIRADIHRAPLSERDLESVVENDNDLDTATVVSEANSQKTEEIEEIFADIPKLPNVAAIIAPKSALKQSNEYLTMTPRGEKMMPMVGIMALSPNTPTANQMLMVGSNKKPDRSALKLNLNNNNNNSFNATPIKSANKNNTPSILRPQLSSANYQQQYKRKHMPNILQEINKRMSLPNSPITPTPPSSTFNKSATMPFGKSSNSSPSLEASESLHSLPLQAEFDWYNLDAEYGKNSQTEQGKIHGGGSDNGGLLGNGVMSSSLLADIKEDGESLINTADEYNLDEEYSDESMTADQATEGNHQEEKELQLNEAINPVVIIAQNHAKAKKIKKNLANFEKFIETSSSSSGGKPAPTKRKIYFAGPFV